MAIAEGSKVTLEYVGTLEDGTEFDSSAKHGQPLQFTVGQKQVIKGFEDGVMGLEKDAEKDIVISPADGYGEYKEEFVQTISRDQLPQDQEPKEGMMLGVKTPDGQEFPALIKSVTEKEVVLDLNHPLAGKTLKFHVKVVNVE